MKNPPFNSLLPIATTRVARIVGSWDPGSEEMEGERGNER